MLHERYYVEKEKQEKLLNRKNVKSDLYNGIYDRYEYPVLTREHIPLTWRYNGSGFQKNKKKQLPRKRKHKNSLLLQ